jgi:hypothetical protein
MAALQPSIRVRWAGAIRPPVVRPSQPPGGPRAVHQAPGRSLRPGGGRPANPHPLPAADASAKEER